jgi:HK97 family phage major capsid protein
MVNPTKQAKERWMESLKELEKRHAAFASDTTNEQAKVAFDEQNKKVVELKAEYARFADYEARIAEGKLDDSSNPDFKTEEELAGMTDVERRSDKVNPLLNPDAKGYRLSRVIDAMALGRQLSGVEAEVSGELQKRCTALGRENRTNALSIPLTLRAQVGQFEQFGRELGLSPKEMRALNAATTGDTAIPTILSGSIIEMLRNKVILNQAGATILSGITGVFDIPKQDAQPSVSIGGESLNPNESSAQISAKVTFTPKTIAGKSQVTRRFMAQAMASLDAENFLRMMLVEQIRLGIDLEGLTGPGSSNRCTGLLENDDVTTIALGTNGGAPTFAKLVAMETAVEDLNASTDGNTMAYITNARGKGTLKTTLKASSAGSTMLWENDEINGYRALMTNQIPKDYTKGTTEDSCSGIVFGDFAHLVIALWTGLDILVDPYTNGGAGATNIYAHQDFDIQVRRAEAFSKIVDMVTTAF